jgi:phosphoserine aminotransferase
MGLLIVSPRAIQNAYQQGETRYYHSLIAQVENTRKQQTTHTPNVLGIYLLARTLADNPPIGTTHQRLQQQAQAYTACLETHPQLSLLVSNVAVRAPTVLAIKAAPEVLTQLYQKAATAGMTLGNGYGAWKHHTLRVANFPAIATEAHQGLIDLLNQYRF